MTHYALATEDWLASHRDADNLIVIDTRPSADYWAGHLPGARHLDASLLTLQRTDAASITRFQGLLGWALSALGIARESRVLVYGAGNEVNVSRVAWALGYAGVQEILLLDGGLAALKAPALVQDASPVQARRFALQPVDAFLATAADAQAAGDGGAAALIDARERDEFLGLKSNARRNGRIPGAIHWNAARELGADGRFQAREQLARDAGEIAGSDVPVVAYCGGGGRAARTFIALQLAGHSRASVYPASWNEWGNQDALPIESGEPSTATA